MTIDMAYKSQPTAWYETNSDPPMNGMKAVHPAYLQKYAKNKQTV